MSFRIQGRNLFLTYPQCSLDRQLIYDHLLKLQVGSESADKICVAKELHEDGNTHYHVFLSYPKRRNITNQRIFDIGNFHPNVQSCRSVKNVLKYVTKDNDYLANFEVVKPTVMDIVSRANDEDDFIRICAEVYGTKFVNCFGNWTAFYARVTKRKKVCEPIGDWINMKIDDLFLISRILSVLGHVKNGSRTKSIWLYGPSKTGKTTLARSIGRHVRLCNGWCVDEIDDDADYLIIDDIDWEKWKYQYKALLGCQTNVVFHGKYARPKVYKFNMPTIVLSNTKPSFEKEELDWIDVNVDFFNIIKRLF